MQQKKTGVAFLSFSDLLFSHDRQLLNIVFLLAFNLIFDFLFLRLCSDNSHQRSLCFQQRFRFIDDPLFQFVQFFDRFNLDFPILVLQRKQSKLIVQKFVTIFQIK
jgi:hypothetical protein